MTSRRFLNSLAYMQRALQIKLDEIERLEAIATGTTSGLGEKVMSSSQGGKVERIAVTVADMQTEIQCDLDKLNRRRADVEDALEWVQIVCNSINEYKILRGMYLPDDRGETKTLVDLSEDLRISYSSATKAHLRGLDLIDEWLKTHWDSDMNTRI